MRALSFACASSLWTAVAALEADPHSARIDAARTPEAFARVLGMYAGASALLWLLICVLARNDRSTRYGHAGGGRYPAVLRCAACFAAKRRSGCGLMAIARKHDCDGCVDDECDVFRNLSDHSVRHYSSRLAQPGAGLGAAARPGARGETHHHCRGAGSASPCSSSCSCSTITPMEASPAVGFLSRSSRVFVHS